MQQLLKKYLQKLPRRKTVHFEGFCANCEQPVNGSYCSNCGQSVKDFQRPFFSVVSESLGDALSFDNRFFHTLLPLIFRPGFITKEFMKGRRVRYTPPFRLYLFLTFFAFLLLSHNHKPETDAEKNITIKNDKGEKIEILSLVEDAFLKDSIPANYLEENAKSEQKLILLDSSTKAQATTDSIAKRIKKEANSDFSTQKKAIKNLNKMWHLNPELVIDMAYKKLSQLLLIILPIFALFLALFYIRKKRYLLEHLLISLNYHSFIFVVVIVSELLVLTQIPELKSFAFYLYLLIPLQLLLTLKFYYQQSWLKTSIKFLFLSIVYNLLLIFGIVFAFASFVVE